MGHLISYYLACEIDTAQALKSQKLSEMSTSVTLKPKMDNDVVLTNFWVDNFDINVDTPTAGGAINSTHLLAFQEESDERILGTQKVNTINHRQ